MKFKKHCLGRRWSWPCWKRDSEHRRSRRFFPFPDLAVPGVQLISRHKSVLYTVAAVESWCRQVVCFFISPSSLCSLYIFKCSLLSSCCSSRIFSQASVLGSLHIGSLCLEHKANSPELLTSLLLYHLLNEACFTFLFLSPLPTPVFFPKHVSFSIARCNLPIMFIIYCVSSSFIFC